MSENMSENQQGWMAPGTSRLDIFSHTTHYIPQEYLWTFGHLELKAKH